MVRSAEKIVFLADHDKIGKVASAFVTDVSNADLLITDDAADDTVLGNLRSEGLVIDLVRSGLESEDEGQNPRSTTGI
jgi:DeoR/GlpR family transcriptional regulator of sugar metabolism